MKITYYGHANFKILSQGKEILIDPFFKDNPHTNIKPEQLSPDAIIVTHGHADHLGDTILIAKKSKAKVISVFEVVAYCQSKGVTNAHPMHIGGAYNFPFGQVKLTIAHHGSATSEGSGGNPCGVILKMEGKVLYHAGDTGLFMDMKLIGEQEQIDVALLPIGDNFTMGIRDAIKAVEFLKPKIAIPMHYNTFPVIEVNPSRFIEGLTHTKTQGILLNPGQSFEV